MDHSLDLIYEGRGFSGTIDLLPWLGQAEGEDVASLMEMATGMPFPAAPYGLQVALRDMAGDDAAAEPHTLVFRDQSELLRILRRDHPLLWEAASGSALRCDDTPDMFGGSA